MANENMNIIGAGQDTARPAPKISRIWAMPNRYTFKIKPIAELLSRYVDILDEWVDPFCGYNSPALHRNDLDEKTPTKFHADALSFLRGFSDLSMDGGIYDPPFNPAQADWCYKGTNKFKRNTEFWKYLSSCRKEYSRLVKTDGFVICCGFNSGGIGMKYGFDLIEVLLVAHGVNRNDTIVTVEKKRSHVLCEESPAQNTVEICHTAPNSGRDAIPQLDLGL